ncbi:Hypothetical predicted protein [Octopus vulgaris]|uniref:Uncharacterized protein n=1 Tax=Octopus vulgaris TaxID=6645 RepID=A0AA36EYF9_OCTVU|nr:Hypothetical predicted protein [Octopus vulgaris]
MKWKYIVKEMKEKSIMTLEYVHQSPKDTNLELLLNMEELEAAIQKTKPEKAPEFHSIPDKVYKCGGNKFWQCNNLL